MSMDTKMKYKPYPAYKESGVEWLGEVPEHWEVKPIKRIASSNDDVLTEKTPDEYEIDYVDISSVNEVEGIIKTEEMIFKNAPSRARRLVKDGDVIVSTVRTYLKAIAPIKSPNENLVVSTGFAVIRPNNGFLPAFAAYLFKAHYLIELIISRSLGVSYPAINSSDLISLKTALPSLEEQQTIATFLDRETAKIDTLIAKQERLIELLQEKRTALISHAVTKGLNPDAPMKESGVEWLGEVPEHWEVKQIRHIAMVLRGKFTHRPRNDPALYDGPYPFVQTGDITSAEKYIMEFKQTLNDKGVAFSKEFPKGTLVMAIAANIGDTAILSFSAYFPDSIVGFFPKNSGDVEYLYFLIGAMKQAMLMMATVNTQMNINVDQISGLKFPLPPIDEQRLIVKFNNAETTKIDTLITKARQAIDLLKERRTALISAAVTGKIDVREVFPSVTPE